MWGWREKAYRVTGSDSAEFEFEVPINFKA